MLKVWEEILQRLRNGEPLEEVRKNCRSDSQFAKALKIYVDELSGKAEEIRKAHLQEDEKLTEAKAEHKHILAENNGLKKDGNSLKEENKALLAQNQSAMEKVDGLKADVEALAASGFTPEVIEKLKKARVKNGAEAMAVLQDLDKAVALRDEVQNLSTKATAQRRSTSSLERKQQNTAKKLLSAKNSLDQAKAEASALEKAVSVVNAALHRNYTPQQLISIFALLEKMEIQKQPASSIERLVEFFGEAKNLSSLKGEQVAVEKRLEQLRGAEADVEIRLELLNSTYLQKLEEQTVKGKEAIAMVTNKAVEEVRKISAEMVEKARVADEALAGSMVEKGKLEQIRSSLEPAFALLGLSSHPKMAETVSPSLVVLLLENVLVWLEQRYPNATTNALYNSVTDEFVSNPYGSPIKIAAYFKFIINCVRDLMARESEGKMSP